jgi:hypothetical protein
MASGSYSTPATYSPAATQTLLEVHDTPPRESPSRRSSAAGSGSGVDCRRQRLPSQLIAPVPAGVSTPPTAVQAVADTHDTSPTSRPWGLGWTDQSRPRAGPTVANITATASSTPTVRPPGLIPPRAYTRQGGPSLRLARSYEPEPAPRRGVTTPSRTRLPVSQPYLRRSPSSALAPVGR